MELLIELVGELLTTGLINKKMGWFIATFVGFIIIGLCIYYGI